MAEHNLAEEVSLIFKGGAREVVAATSAEAIQIESNFYAAVTDPATSVALNLPIEAGQGSVRIRTADLSGIIRRKV